MPSFSGGVNVGPFVLCDDDIVPRLMNSFTGCSCQGSEKVASNFVLPPDSCRQPLYPVKSRLNCRFCYGVTEKADARKKSARKKDRPDCKGTAQYGCTRRGLAPR